MLERVHIKNYRSIVDATVDLQPFTLLVGANGSGKSNLLRLLADLSKRAQRPRPLTPHFRAPTVSPSVAIHASGGQFVYGQVYGRGAPDELKSVSVFSIDPVLIGGGEQLKARPEVLPNGSGAIQVLDSLKNRRPRGSLRRDRASSP